MAAVLSVPVNDQDHWKGFHASASVLVEYGGYQCPGSGHAFQLVNRIIHDFPNKIKFVFRHFPLRQIHPLALAAAMASEAAAKQGKFWEMHDLIFENRLNLEAGIFLDFAETLEFYKPKFEHDRTTQHVMAKVEGDFQSGVTSGVINTPAFFVNGLFYEYYDGTYTSLKRVISV